MSGSFWKKKGTFSLQKGIPRVLGLFTKKKKLENG
jgi:hypothetical protein